MKLGTEDCWRAQAFAAPGPGVMTLHHHQPCFLPGGWKPEIIISYHLKICWDACPFWITTAALRLFRDGSEAIWSPEGKGARDEFQGKRGSDSLPVNQSWGEKKEKKKQNQKSRNRRRGCCLVRTHGQHQQKKVVALRFKAWHRFKLPFFDLTSFSVQGRQQRGRSHESWIRSLLHHCMAWLHTPLHFYHCVPWEENY